MRPTMTATSTSAHVVPGAAHAARDASRMRLPVLLSILGPIVWMVFTLLYVGFWANGFSLFQSFVVVLVSLLILGGVMGSIWTVWGLRHRPDWWD